MSIPKHGQAINCANSKEKQHETTTSLAYNKCHYWYHFLISTREKKETFMSSLKNSQLSIFYMTDYFSSRSAGQQGQQVLPIILDALLILIGLAATSMYFARRADPRMQANNSRRYGLLILGLVVIALAVFMLLQGFVLG